MSLTEIVEETAAAVAANTAAASITFAAAGASTGPVGTTVQARQHTVQIDEPPALGGQDTGVNPIEAALAAIISCQVVTYRFWAAHLGIRIEDILVSAEGDLDVRGFLGLDETVRPGLMGVRLAVTLTGPEPERYEELRLAVDAHCPVKDLFSSSTPVVTTLTIEAAG